MTATMGETSGAGSEDAATRSRVVDCDTHFWQPLELWSRFVAPEHADAVKGYLGTDRVTLPTPDSQALTTDASGRRYRDRGDEAEARLADMDAEGIDVQVIFPGASKATTIPDADVSAAACRAVNRWNAEFAEAAPDRLKPSMVLPMRYPDRALEEVHFATTELGLGSAFVAPTPAPERRWSDPELDPVWKAMEAAGVVVCFHEFTVSRLDLGYPSVARKSYGTSYPMMYLCEHTVEMQLALMDLIFGGVMERFPTLAIGFIEAHTAWLPGWLAQMDSLGGWLANHKRGAKGERHMSLLPTEFFQRQCFVASFPDDAWISEALQYIGGDNVVLCTDYPHPGTSQGLAETFTKSYPDLSNEVRVKLLGSNADRIFRLTD